MLAVRDCLIQYIGTAYPMSVSINQSRNVNFHFAFIAPHLVDISVITCQCLEPLSHAFDCLSYPLQSAHIEDQSIIYPLHNTCSMIIISTVTIIEISIDFMNKFQFIWRPVQLGSCCSNYPNT